MPKGGYLSIVPGDVDVFIEPPIATDGLGYEDRTTLRDQVRTVISTRLAATDKPSA
jgi:hypothetical protein